MQLGSTVPTHLDEGVDGINVQVIAWLIQKQDVRLGESELGGGEHSIYQGTRGRGSQRGRGWSQEASRRRPLSCQAIGLAANNSLVNLSVLYPTRRSLFLLYALTPF